MKTRPRGRVPYRTHWEQCRCGKVLCDSEVDARRKATAQQFANGSSNPFDVYPCRYAAGVWHWTQVGDTHECPCGQKDLTQAVAMKEVHRINRARVADPVQAKAYQCPHGGHHWLWYPARRKFHYCRPDEVPAYADESAAELIAAFHAGNHPGTDYTVRRCDHDRWHVTESASDHS